MACLTEMEKRRGHRKKLNEDTNGSIIADAFEPLIGNVRGFIEYLVP